VDVRVANVALGRIAASKEAGNRMAAVSNLYLFFSKLILILNLNLLKNKKKLIKIL
jgi:hypothetical protein